VIPAALIAVIVLALLGMALSALDRRAEKGERRTGPGPLSAVLYLGLPLVLFAFIPAVLLALPERETKSTVETGLPLLLAGGVVLLLLSLATTAVIYNQLGLVDKREALGLPPGSVRAVIALALLLIFAIMSIYIYSRQASITLRQTDGLTQQQVDAIPGRELVSVIELPLRTAAPSPTAPPSPSPGEPSPPPLPSPTPIDTTPRFRVERQLVGAESANDIAQQLITTVSTLAVAISAFYFGSNSVQAAQKALQRTPAPKVVIAGSAVRRTRKVGETWEPVVITVLTEPRGLPVVATVVGDDDGVIKRTDDEEFTYTPGAKPMAMATLRFALKQKPETFEEVIVHTRTTAPPPANSDDTPEPPSPDSNEPVRPTRGPDTGGGSTPKTPEAEPQRAADAQVSQVSAGRGPVVATTPASAAQHQPVGDPVAVMKTRSQENAPVDEAKTTEEGDASRETAEPQETESPERADAGEPLTTQAAADAAEQLDTTAPGDTQDRPVQTEETRPADEIRRKRQRTDTNLV
jgi:hypothetical protein